MNGIYGLLPNVDPFSPELEFKPRRITMTHALTNWLWRILSTATRPVQNPPDPAQRPMKVEVERLPDYLWRELGFRQIRRPDDDPWWRLQ
jgi:hypothetical protein